jgi:hypothetical protein
MTAVALKTAYVVPRPFGVVKIPDWRLLWEYYSKLFGWRRV